jgi:hypothetical protein
LLKLYPIITEFSRFKFLPFKEKKKVWNHVSKVYNLLGRYKVSSRRYLDVFKLRRIRVEPELKGVSVCFPLPTERIMRIF